MNNQLLLTMHHQRKQNRPRRTRQNLGCFLLTWWFLNSFAPPKRRTRTRTISCKRYAPQQKVAEKCLVAWLISHVCVLQFSGRTLIFSNSIDGVKKIQNFLFTLR